MKLTIEFSGGLEALTGGKKLAELEWSSGSEIRGSAQLSAPRTVRDLIAYVDTHLIKDQHELFRAGSSVRPGVLVLIDDSDWELFGQLDCGRVLIALPATYLLHGALRHFPFPGVPSLTPVMVFGSRSVALLCCGLPTFFLLMVVMFIVTHRPDPWWTGSGSHNTSFP